MEAPFELIGKISSEFIKLDAQEIDNAINNALKLVSGFTGVDRGYVFLVTKDQKKLELTHEWAAQGVLPHKGILESFNVGDFENFVNSLKQGEMMKAHAADIPRTPEYKSMIDVLDLLEIKSFINLPIFISDEFIGFVGFETTKKQTEWPEDVVNAFNLTGEIIGNALERKRTEELLRESEEKLRATVTSMEDLLLVLDKNNIFLDYYQSPSFSDLYIPPEVFLGKSFTEIPLPPEVIKSFKTAIKKGADSGKVQQVDYFLEMEGEIRWFSAKISIRKDRSGLFDGVIVAVRDVTEQKKLQERLMRQEKLALLGQLAGGVGHELRNPLGVIKNAAYFLNMVLEDPDPEVKETLEILDKEVAASERIINTLLEFARARPPRRQEVHIGRILEEVLSGAKQAGDIEVITQMDKSLPPIPADPDQLVQIFRNIILNAIQAMPEGGSLTIKTEAAVPHWITVFITDTGVGISKEHLGKIFEPLFTGKAKGIGLGMAITKTFVEGHGGTIDVQSKVGKGSTFKIRLPLREK